MMRAGAAALWAALLTMPAQSAGPAGAPPGALSCSGCHAVPTSSSAVPPIHGRPAGEIEEALGAFRTGARPATVMNRIAPGFTPAESHAIAVWLSLQPPPR